MEFANQPESLRVADVRRALATIRRKWDDMSRSEHKPMYLGTEIHIENLSIEDFALQFVLSHHSKRLGRVKS